MRSSTLATLVLLVTPLPAALAAPIELIAAEGWVVGDLCERGDARIIVELATGVGHVELSGDQWCRAGHMYDPGECAREAAGDVVCAVPWCIGCGELRLKPDGDFHFKIGDFVFIEYTGHVDPIL